MRCATVGASLTKAATRASAGTMSHRSSPRTALHTGTSQEIYRASDCQEGHASRGAESTSGCKSMSRNTFHSLLYNCSLCDLFKSRFMLLGMDIISLWIQRSSLPAGLAVLHVAQSTGLHVCTYPTASSRSAIATRTQRAGSFSKRRRPGNAARSTGCANGSSTKLDSARTAAARTPGAAASYATSPAHHPCHGPGL